MAKGNLWIGLIVGILIYFVMTIYCDYEKVLTAIASFRIGYIPILLVLALMNYILRATKWHYFFKIVHLDVTFKENLFVFLSGLLMAITPGKFGEVWKSWLIRDIKGYDIHRTIPIVFMDRITDIVALVILASLGVFVFNMSMLSFCLVVTLLLSMLTLLRSKNIMLIAFGRSRRFDKIKEAYLCSQDLLRISPFILTVMISIIAWFMECLAFYLTFRGLSVDAGLFESTFIYAISSIAGALTMLPGGLGVTEASLAGLSSHLMNQSESTALAATLIIRAVTLWFAVGLGTISYFLGWRVLYRKSA